MGSVSAWLRGICQDWEWSNTVWLRGIYQDWEWSIRVWLRGIYQDWMGSIRVWLRGIYQDWEWSIRAWLRGIYQDWEWSIRVWLRAICGDRDPKGWGEKGDYTYRSTPCYHQNDFCIKMGSSVIKPFERVINCEEHTHNNNKKTLSMNHNLWSES